MSVLQEISDVGATLRRYCRLLLTCLVLAQDLSGQSPSAATPQAANSDSKIGPIESPFATNKISFVFQGGDVRRNFGNVVTALSAASVLDRAPWTVQPGDTLTRVYEKALGITLDSDSVTMLARALNPGLPID